MEFVKNNYLRTLGSGKTFKFEVDPPSNKTADFHSTTLEVAQEVYLKKQGKLYLMYSGGVDSEYLLNVYLSLGIDIVPVIVRLNPNYNYHDVKYAFDFCQSKKLKPIIIDINFDDFVKSGKIIDVAESCQCGAYQLPSTFYAVSQLDGTVVMGSHGPPHMKKTENEEWVVDEMEAIHSVLTYFKNNKIYGCPFLLSYTAEQYFSFLNDPVMVDLANNKIPGKLGNHSTKGLVYNNVSGYKLEKRQKYTGYENIENREIFQHEHIKWFETVGKKWYGTFDINYFDLIKKLE